MSEKPAQPSKDAKASDLDELLAQSPSRKQQAPVQAARPSASMRDLWQGPALAAGAALFLAGVVAAFASRPGYDIRAALQTAAQQIDGGEHKAALDLLNGRIREHLVDHDEPDETRAQFHRMRAEAVFRFAHAEAPGSVDNHREVVREYGAAEEFGAQLGPADVARLAESLLLTGDVRGAIERARQIPDEDAARRRLLLKQIIRSAMASMDRIDPEEGGPLAERRRLDTLGLLTELATDPKIDEGDRIWTIARQAELRMRAGYSREAIEHLLREMQRLSRLDTEQAAELFVLLGQAYFDEGQPDEAAKQLQRADATLAPTDERRAQVDVLLGQIAMMRGDPEGARERFATVTQSFGGAKYAPAAWLGLAEAEGALGAWERSVEAYQVLAETIAKGGSGREGSDGAVTLEAFDASIEDRVRERLERGDQLGTLRFGAIPAAARRDGSSPPWAMHALARAHRELAEQTQRDALPGGDPMRADEIDPVTQREIKTHLLAAAELYRDHASAVIGKDDDAYGSSLWNAADAFDRAGDHRNAISVFSEFVSGRPDDGRRPRARFRLAQAHQALEEFDVAATLYRELIRENPSSGEGYRSYVPLAACLFRDGDEGNDAEAEALLRRVLSGSVLGPEAPEYRLALEELGQHHLRSGRLLDAIGRFTEALERFPQARTRLLNRYRLAEALRLSAAEITVTLRQAMPESQRRELERIRHERLTQALAEYERVALKNDEPPGRRYDAAEEVAIRNAFFFRADCAYDLGQDDLAIEYYDAAAQRHTEDPASLVAMVQIVNAYARTGRWHQARTAHERARQRFHELPADAFERDDLPMERRHWERWLDSAAELAQHPGED